MKDVSILPVVITIRGTGVSLLACGRRFLHTGIEKDSVESTTFTSLYWPVAIQVKPTIKILYDLRLGEGETEAHLDIATVPLHRVDGWQWPFLLRKAEAALVDAHRTVSDPVRTGWNGEKAHFTAKPEMLTNYKGGTIFRNINAWLAWDTWERQNVTYEQRAEILRSYGFKCTTKALERAAQMRGF